MATPVRISEFLKGIDLVWWPEFLLHHAREEGGIDTGSLGDSPGKLTHEDSSM